MSGIIPKTGQWADMKTDREAKKKTALPMRFPQAIEVPQLSNEIIRAEQLRVYTVVVAADGSGDYEDVASGVDALPSTGGEVFIKAGGYEIDTTITVGSNIKITGEGAATALKLAERANCSLFHLNAADHSSVNFLRMDGNKANQTVATPLLHLENLSYNKFFEIFTQNSLGDNILLEASTLVAILHSASNGAGLSGMKLLNSHYTPIISFGTYGNLNHGLELNASTYTGCTGVGGFLNGGNGLYLSNTSVHNIFTGTLFSLNTGYGIAEESAADDYNIITSTEYDTANLLGAHDEIGHNIVV